MDATEESLYQALIQTDDVDEVITDFQEVHHLRKLHSTSSSPWHQVSSQGPTLVAQSTIPSVYQVLQLQPAAAMHQQHVIMCPAADEDPNTAGQKEALSPDQKIIQEEMSKVLPQRQPIHTSLYSRVPSTGIMAPALSPYRPTNSEVAGLAFSPVPLENRPRMHKHLAPPSYEDSDADDAGARGSPFNKVSYPYGNNTMNGTMGDNKSLMMQPSIDWSSPRERLPGPRAELFQRLPPPPMSLSPGSGQGVADEDNSFTLPDEYEWTEAVKKHGGGKKANVDEEGSSTGSYTSYGSSYSGSSYTGSESSEGLPKKAVAPKGKAAAPAGKVAKQPAAAHVGKGKAQPGSGQKAVSKAPLGKTNPRKTNAPIPKPAAKQSAQKVATPRPQPKKNAAAVSSIHKQPEKNTTAAPRSVSETDSTRSSSLSVQQFQNMIQGRTVMAFVPQMTTLPAPPPSRPIGGASATRHRDPSASMPSFMVLPAETIHNLQTDGQHPARRLSTGTPTLQTPAATTTVSQAAQVKVQAEGSQESREVVLPPKVQPEVQTSNQQAPMESKVVTTSCPVVAEEITKEGEEGKRPRTSPDGFLAVAEDIPKEATAQSAEQPTKNATSPREQQQAPPPRQKKEKTRCFC